MVCCLFFFVASCRQKVKTEITPWGSPVVYDSMNADSVESNDDEHYTLCDIQQTGEMIMLTLSGPNTYYEYHGRGMGVNYLLCEKLAEHLE